MKKIWEILVPTVMPDGTLIRTRRHREWDTRARRVSGGLTVMQPARGQWLSPSDKLFTERMIPVRIVCTRREIDTIADMTAAFYEQEAVMYYCISHEVYIKNYEG